MPDYVQYFTKPIIEIFWNSSMNLKINSLFKNQKNETEKRKKRVTEIIIFFTNISRETKF